MQLNAVINSVSRNEDAGIPGFQFLNIDNDPDEENTDAEVEEILFEQDDIESASSSSVDMPALTYPESSSDEDSDGDILDDEAHVMFAHITKDMRGYAFLQRGRIGPNWILLDTGSSIDVLSNPDLITNIHRSEQYTQIHCNAVIVRESHNGTLPGYVEVWFNKDGIENILSMSNMVDKLPVTCNSHNDDRFIIQKPDEQLIFNCSQSGMYFHDVGDRDIVMVANVSGNREG
mmetsp:Transcript_53098/g.158898  ORF Transcript_53098/g.158898 Transcript_53098/m.158898 type:complete len:232 (-) Transcript_53098:6-701(-)